MNGKTFERALAALNMSKQDIAALFDISLRCAQNYAKDGVTNTPTMILINLMLLGKITKYDIGRAKTTIGRKNTRAPVRGSYGPAD